MENIVSLVPANWVFLIIWKGQISQIKKIYEQESNRTTTVISDVIPLQGIEQH